MNKDISTKDLDLGNNEKLYLKERKVPFIKFPVIKNLTSKYLKFFTFEIESSSKIKKDNLLVIYFIKPVNFSSVYSKTSTPAAPIIWNKKNNNGLCKLLIVNSNSANAHTGNKGIKNIDSYVRFASKKFKCNLNQVLVSSTGVIGEHLDVSKINKAIKNIDLKEKNLLDASKAIMTTDTFSKTFLSKIKHNSKEIKIFGIAKGSGMIFPNMGTMLSYIFIEANLSKINLNKILKNNLDKSFNSITVDGDTSTNDTVVLFSLHDENNKPITNIDKLSSSIQQVMHNLSTQIICDGEGISKLMQINVSNAKSYNQASKIAFSIGNSPLVKTAVAAEDANWGRIIMAIGKTNEKINQLKIKLKFGNLLVATNGQISKKINVKKLNTYMKKKKIEINLDLQNGKFSRTIFASDLTHEYVKINGDYRS